MTIDNLNQANALQGEKRDIQCELEIFKIPDLRAKLSVFNVGNIMSYGSTIPKELIEMFRFTAITAMEARINAIDGEFAAL
jgi:hypothetical protein